MSKSRDKGNREKKKPKQEKKPKSTPSTPPPLKTDQK